MRKPLTKDQVFPDENFRALDLTELFIWFDSLKPQQTIDTTYEDVTDTKQIESTGTKAIECKAQEAE